MSQKSSLAELMGSAGASAQGKLSLEHLPALLGEGMPELPRNPLGRHRLIRALQQRFGPNYRSLPGVSGLVAQFDSEIDHEVRLAKMRAVNYSPKG